MMTLLHSIVYIYLSCFTLKVNGFPSSSSFREINVLYLTHFLLYLLHTYSIVPSV